MNNVLYPTPPNTTIQMDWGHMGNLTSGTSYLSRGSGIEHASPIKLRITRACVANTMSLRLTTGPGGTRTDTWTLQKNGVDTALFVSITDGAVSAVSNGTSVAFAMGDDVSLKQVVSVSSTSADVQVTCDFD